MKNRSVDEKKVIICISGMTGCGKSTVAKKLAAKYDLDYFSGGDALKLLAQEEGYTSNVTGWWETAEGLKFLEQRMSDQAFDRRIDEKLLELAKQGNVILDSWTMPWLLKDGFKIWLEASPKVRAKRVVTRDDISQEEALNALTKKDEQTRQIYKNLYGFDLGNDLSPFNIVLATDELEPEEVFHALCLVTDRLIFKET
ncbi:MAG: cytidylate kinase [Candidatus Bathyarchaeum sp.]|nr:MAG: cytidylate kinase [Candidatus Bathyarchaeum sp.]